MLKITNTGISSRLTADSVNADGIQTQRTLRLLVSIFLGRGGVRNLGRIPMAAVQAVKGKASSQQMRAEGSETKTSPPPSQCCLSKL